MVIIYHHVVVHYVRSILKILRVLLSLQCIMVRAHGNLFLMVNIRLKKDKQTDAEYWNVFNYKFLQGRPYTKEEVINGANLAVITRSLKELLFGNVENVLGKTIKYTSLDLIIIGVVEDPPATDQNASWRSLLSIHNF